MRQPLCTVVVVAGQRTGLFHSPVRSLRHRADLDQRFISFFVGDSSSARLCMLLTILRSRAPLRALHTARTLRNQKWAHLTNILAGEIPPPVQVKSITPAGVLLQDGRLLPSACIFLEGEVLLWDVPPTLWAGWDESKFEVFDVVVPKPGASLWPVDCS
jgi:NADH dehydrogenase [ubiquinone] 1 alpha subcomplex assembly factor 3